MNQPQPTDPENPTQNPEYTIQQNAEDSIISGGMQAIAGNNNKQNQASSSSTGNVVNVNVSVDSSIPKVVIPSENKPRSGCFFQLVLGSFIISIAIGNIILLKDSINLPGGGSYPTPTLSVSDEPYIIYRYVKQSADYSELKFLLKKRKWEDADFKTRSIMLKASKKQEDDILTIRDIATISCDNIYVINWLWSEYSYKEFGFDIQSRIWVDSGRNYLVFSERVGWLNDDSWLKQEQENDQENNLNLSLSKSGSFPRTPWWGIMDTTEGVKVVFRKIDDCKSIKVNWDE